MTVRVRADASAASVASAPVFVRGGDAPAGLVVALAVAVSLANVAGWLGLSLLRNRPSALVLLVAAGVSGVGLVGRLRPRTVPVGGVRAFLLALPAAGVLAVAVVGLLRGAPRGLEWFLNGDHPRHAVYVADTWVQGSLTYAVEPYPRGWHSFLAASWSVIGAGLDGGHLTRLLVLMATASLVLSAALALAMAHLGHALATRVGLRGRAAIGVGVLVGALTLLNFALANYQALGYENSILAAVVLAVCGREALIRPGSTVSLVVSAAGTLVVAHCWQLLLPPVAVAALWCAVRALRGGERWPRRAVAVLVPLTLVLGAPGVLAVVSEVGLSHAMEAGPDSPVPLILLGPGLVSAFVVAVHRRRDGATTCLAVVTMLPAVIAMVLAVGLGLDLLHYYPSKLLWQSTVLSLPWLGVLGSLAVAAGLRRVPSATNVISRLVGVPVGVVTAFAMVLPWGSQLGVWSSVDGQRVMGAVTASGASDAVVVWLEDSPTTDSITRSLIDVLRVGRTRDRAPQARVSVAQECAMLQTAASPVVLSTASEAMVRARYGCVHDVVVLHVTPAR